MQTPLQGIPQLRFSGFEENQIVTEMGQVADICTGDSDLKDADPKGAYPFFVRSDMIQRSNRYLYDGEAILVPGEGRIGEIFHYVNGKFDYHQRVYKISDFQNVSGKYIFYYLQRHLKAHLLRSTVKATVDSIRLPALKEFQLKIPQNEEQEDVSSFFWELDAALEAGEKKLEKLRHLKQTMLAKMFPQGDSLVPEFRFVEFTGPWESASLFDLVTIGNGQDYKHLQRGEYPVYGTGGYMLSVNQFLSGQDSVGIGRKGTIDKPYILKAPFWTVDTLFFATPRPKVDLYFLYALALRIPWRLYDESTGVPSLSKDNIYKIPSFAPTYKEQQAIGSYFRELDTLLEAEEEKLVKLRQLKSAFLRQMFV